MSRVDRPLVSKDAGSSAGMSRGGATRSERRQMWRGSGLGLAGLGWIVAFARGADGLPADPPPKERVVSPRVAALLAAAVANIEATKSATEKARGEKPKDEKTDATAVVMAPFHVTESAQKERLLERVTQQQDAPKAPAFTLKDGGTIFEKGPFELKFKYNAQHKGFDILNLRF